MTCRKRSRTQAQKVHRKFNDRLSTLRSKIEELNAIKENRAIIVWTDKEEQLAYGDKQLLERLGFPVQDFQNPLCCPTSSPTSSAISAVSTQESFQQDQDLSEDTESCVLKAFQRKKGQTNSTDENRLKLCWRKEDLDSLAFNFFSY